MIGQAPCVVSQTGLTPNPNRWTEKFNFLALDHVCFASIATVLPQLTQITKPIGVGFSYGTHVNSSTAAAADAYDFLQKFYSLFPHLAKFSGFTTLAMPY